MKVQQNTVSDELLLLFILHIYEFHDCWVKRTGGLSPPWNRCPVTAVWSFASSEPELLRLWCTPSGHSCTPPHTCTCKEPRLHSDSASRQCDCCGAFPYSRNKNAAKQILLQNIWNRAEAQQTINTLHILLKWTFQWRVKFCAYFVKVLQDPSQYGISISW